MSIPKYRDVHLLAPHLVKPFPATTSAKCRQFYPSMTRLERRVPFTFLSRLFVFVLKVALLSMRGCQCLLWQHLFPHVIHLYRPLCTVFSLLWGLHNPSSGRLWSVHAYNTNDRHSLLSFMKQTSQIFIWESSTLHRKRDTIWIGFTLSLDVCSQRRHKSPVDSNDANVVRVGEMNLNSQVFYAVPARTRDIVVRQLLTYIVLQRNPMDLSGNLSFFMLIRIRLRSST